MSDLHLRIKESHVLYQLGLAEQNEKKEKCAKGMIFDSVCTKQGPSIESQTVFLEQTGLAKGNEDQNRDQIQKLSFSVQEASLHTQGRQSVLSTISLAQDKAEKTKSSEKQTYEMENGNSDNQNIEQKDKQNDTHNDENETTASNDTLNIQYQRAMTINLKKRKSGVSYRSRNNIVSLAVTQFLQNKTYRLVSMIFSVCALFSRDLCFAFFGKAADFYLLNIWLTTVYAFLMCELILYCIAHANYALTFFFWLDLIGVTSILIDIPWIVLGVGLPENVFLIVKGGRMGRAARSANATKLVKFLKMIRMIRLFRIVHVFKSKAYEHTSDSDTVPMLYDEASVHEAKPTKMGTILADKITQKIVLGVLITFVVFPLFDIEQTDNGDATYHALESMEWTYSNHHDPNTGAINTDFESLWLAQQDRFKEYHDGADVRVLEIGSTSNDFSQTLINLSTNELRSVEKLTFVSDSTKSICIISLQQEFQEEALLNMGLTVLIMLGFTTCALMLNMDIFSVVYPLEYLVIMVKKISGIALTGSESALHDMDDQSLIVDGAENSQDQDVTTEQFVAAVMASITDIFYSRQRTRIFWESLRNKDTDQDDNDLVDFAPVVEE